MFEGINYQQDTYSSNPHHVRGFIVYYDDGLKLKTFNGIELFDVKCMAIDLPCFQGIGDDQIGLYSVKTLIEPT